VHFGRPLTAADLGGVNDAEAARAALLVQAQNLLATV
jgi:hypothetical protein